MLFGASGYENCFIIVLFTKQGNKVEHHKSHSRRYAYHVISYLSRVLLRKLGLVFVSAKNNIKGAVQFRCNSAVGQRPYSCYIDFTNIRNV